MLQSVLRAVEEVVLRAVETISPLWMVKGLCAISLQRQQVASVALLQLHMDGAIGSGC